MIGNDVVDLAFASKESNWKRRGFLKKIYTESEQYCIMNSENPELTVWLMWSMKESAYKIHMRQFRESFFAPLRFECRIINGLHNNFSGQVLSSNSEYTTMTEYINGSIFTLAFEENCTVANCIINKKINFSDKYYNKQHKAIYTSVLKEISRIKDKPLEQFNIKKDYIGIPEIIHNGEKLNMLLSLSHHGRYGAYVIAEDQFIQTKSDNNKI
jgi:phosphopantetheinyl transferase (holo-ACP synthase)